MIIDSNIFIYATSSTSPKGKAARDYLLENSEQLEVTHQNILEVLRVITHTTFPKPMELKAAQIIISEIIEGCTVLSPNDKTIYVFLELIEKYHLVGNRIFDAYLVATALSNGINEIVTDNVKDFQKFDEIKVLNPFSRF